MFELIRTNIISFVYVQQIYGLGIKEEVWFFCVKAELRLKWDGFEIDKRQTEILLDGKSIDIQIQKDVSYKDMNENGEKLCNLLYFTGYLTEESKYFEESNTFVKACMYIYHHTAIEYYSVDNQVYYDVYVSLDNLFTAFDI